MINLTPDDVKYICSDILQPLLIELNGTQERQVESINRIFNIIGDAINDIRYEQERDRRFYKLMFSEALLKNQLFTPAGYDEFYKNWCEEFDRLNKEQINEKK